MQTSAFLKMFKVFSSLIILSSLWIEESNGDFYGNPEYSCIYPCRCDDRPIDPVCAVNMRTFKNLCFLDLYNRNMAARGIYLRRLYHAPCFQPGHPNYDTQYNRPPYEEPYADEFFDAPNYDDPSDFSYDPSPDNTYVGQPYNMDPVSYVNPNFNADPGNLALPSYSSSYGAAAPIIPVIPSRTNNISRPASTVLPVITVIPETTTQAISLPVSTLPPAPVSTLPPAPVTNLPPAPVSTLPPAPSNATTLPPTPSPAPATALPPTPMARQDTVIIPLNATAATTLPPTTPVILPSVANATEAAVNATTTPVPIATSPIATNETTTIGIVVETTTLLPNSSSRISVPGRVTPAPIYPNAAFPHRQYGPIQA